MFTGIVEEVGSIKAIGQRLVVIGPAVVTGIKVSDSIAINGACLTVTELGSDTFTVEVMPETWRRTNLGSLRTGDKVNLERALAVGDRMGGHFVQGHVDGTGKVLSMTPEEEAVSMRLSTSEEIMPYLVEKGFISVDGVSLTVVEREATSFGVSLVTYTRQNTTLGDRRPGDLVNLEVDIIAKHLYQLAGKSNSGITADFLAEHGFME